MSKGRCEIYRVAWTAHGKGFAGTRSRNAPRALLARLIDCLTDLKVVRFQSCHMCKVGQKVILAGQ